MNLSSIPVYSSPGHFDEVHAALDKLPGLEVHHQCQDTDVLGYAGCAFADMGDMEGVEEMRYGMHISPRDNRLSAWGTMLASALLSFGQVNEAIEAAEHACRVDDKIFLPRLVLAVAQNTAGNIDAGRAAFNDARRIRPQLSIQDIGRFANEDEINRLEQAGLL